MRRPLGISIVTLSAMMLAVFYMCGAAAQGQDSSLASSRRTRYTIRDLGTLGGGNSVPIWLTNSGEVVGYSETGQVDGSGSPILHAFRWASKTPNGIAEIPLTPLAVEAFKSQMLNAGPGPFLFPSDKNPSGHHRTLKTAWRKTLKRAGVLYFRIYDLRSTYGTRLSAGGVADEWVTQLLRQGDAKVFKKYSQMKLQMKREALEKINRRANEMPLDSGTVTIQ
jgi:hypothetical protein